MSGPEEAQRRRRATPLPITSAGTPETVPHGGDLDAARRRFPEAPQPWIDLSTGINPIAYPVPSVPVDRWARLPERTDEARLLATAARRYAAASAECIAVAPGSQALIQLLPRLVAPARVAVVGPSYDEHALCWRRQGHEVTVADSLATALSGDVRIVIVVNPNNPTGRLHDVTELRAAAASLARQGGLLVVDEAFVDVMPVGASLVPSLPDNAVVLRSFGKTYGLAGLRLGFAAARPEIARAIRAEFGPWSVSGPAIAIGARALADDAWLADATRRLTSDQERMDRLLTGIGASVLGGTPLFRLAAHPEAASVVERLGRHGIHVRAFPQTPTWIRFGIPGADGDWRRLQHALSG